MNVEIIVDGHPWKVTVEPGEQPGQFAITINGTSRLVDASWIDADTLSLIDGTMSREIRVHRRENGAVGVEVEGRIYETAISAKRVREGTSGRAEGTTRHHGSASAVAMAIKAPMPGRVVRVLVAAGDRVKARQGVVVVEAMKMENELRAPADGTVKDIRVEPGAAVESGAVLLVIGD